jgi:hypothetical protein
LNLTHSTDLHNFGQRVKRIARASGAFYQKPRTLFWEWLFFGTTSPLRSQLDQVAGGSLLTGWFGLEIQGAARDSSGEVREYSPSPGAAIEPLDAAFENFGALLGYCYALGIRDLHRFNLVRGARGLQVIDAEVVFTQLLLPQETLLLPFKDTPFAECGLSLLVEKADQLTPKRVQAILQGYCNSLSILGACAPTLLQAIQRELIQAPDTPVRHILRDTRRYQDWEKNRVQEDYLPEEVLQLERGDIPYFFKLMGSPELWYYSSPTGSREAVTVPERLSDAVGRDASPAALLLTAKRLLDQLMPVGALYLSRSLLPNSFEGELTLSADRSIYCTPDRLEVSIGQKKFGAARHRAD